MHQGKYVFSQIMETVVRYQFDQCVLRYQGERRMRRFTCWEQFLSLAFGQLSFRESLRDIVVCLNAQQYKLYHLGFHGSIALPTLARANEHRDWRIYRDYARLLIQEARRLYINDPVADLNLAGAVYAIDSTTIELCLTLFPWARLAGEQASIKLNMELCLSGSIPAFFDFSSSKEHDVLFLDRIIFEPGAHYVFDRGYLSFARWYAIHQSGAFFVSRAKCNMSFCRLYSHPVDKATGVHCDQTIVLAGRSTKRLYPEKLRRIKYWDQETNQEYVFLTNDFVLSASTIALLYKYRWQVELFFKWIKQHLSIKAFWGRSENAVKTQICVALCVYLLVAILKKRADIDRSSYEILQILSVSLFEKIPLFKLISRHPLHIQKTVVQKRASLWDLLARQ